MASSQTETNICNLALELLGGAQITTLIPPVGAHAKTMAIKYPQCLKAELRKRRWRFALSVEQLTVDPTWTRTTPRRYRYQVPTAVVRVFLPQNSELLLMGNHVYSDCLASPLEVDVVRNDIELDLYDPLFVDVLAARLAMDCAEKVTQSNTKKADAKDTYDEAVKVAGRMNAFDRGPQVGPVGSWVETLGQ